VAAAAAAAASSSKTHLSPSEPTPAVAGTAGRGAKADMGSRDRGDSCSTSTPALDINAADAVTFAALQGLVRRPSNKQPPH
jgi:hypothetical protein